MFENKLIQLEKRNLINKIEKAVNLDHYIKTDFHSSFTILCNKKIQSHNVPLLQLRNKKHIKELLIFCEFIIIYLKDTLALLHKCEHKQFTQK